MADTVDGASARQMLHQMADHLQQHRGCLDTLDAAIGDGDHGTTLARGFAAAVTAAAPSAATSADTPGGVFLAFGNQLRDHVGGASGPLYSTLFTSLGRELGDAPAADLILLARGFAAAADQVARRGGACVGDATLLDALQPYAESLADAASTGLSLAQGLHNAAQAALAGAKATAALVPRRGRARAFGDRAVGREDPGARSFSILAAAIENVAGAR